MRRLVRLLRDPLVHFLAAGAVLFGAYHLIRGSTQTRPDNDTIVVDRSRLLTFLQYQSMAFQPRYFNAKFDAMSLPARKELIDKYVQEEALYRQAQAMGLTEGDYVIRRRVIQKVLYLLDDTAAESYVPTEAQLRDYYQSHQERYQVIPSLTFTHVFVDDSIRRPQTAQSTAEALKQQLMAKRVGFNDAPGYGDRFPYQQNYVGRDAEFIKAQFGQQFAEAVLKLSPSQHTWYGPIKSQFGYHLVLLTGHSPPYVPPLSSIHEEVKDDLLRDHTAAYREKGIADLVSRFKVQLTDISLTPPAKVAANSPAAGQFP